MRQIIIVGRPGSLARTMTESKQLARAGGADTRSAVDSGPSSGRLIKPCRARRLRPVIVNAPQKIESCRRTIFEIIRRRNLSSMPQSLCH